MASTKSLVERTAKSAFTLDGQLVRAGQIVPLTSRQLRRLAEAGCVEYSDEANEDVPVAMLADPTPAPTAVVGEKGQTIDLTDDEWAKLNGLDAALVGALRDRPVADILDADWARLRALDTALADRIHPLV